MKFTETDKEWLESLLEVPEGTELKTIPQEVFDSYWGKKKEESESRISQYQIPKELQEIVNELNQNKDGYKYLVRDTNEQSVFAYLDIIERENTGRWFIGTKYHDTLSICCHGLHEVINAINKLKEIEGNGFEFYLSHQIQIEDDPLRSIELYKEKLGFTK